MRVKAIAKDQRISARKVRPVLRSVQGMRVTEALRTLDFMPQKGALLAAQVLRSAQANAENNFDLNPEALIVFSATADEGVTMKRWRARSRGRSAPQNKRTAHIQMIVEG